MTILEPESRQSRLRSERGNGLISTTAGVGVVLVLLLFASHVLVSLHTATTVSHAALTAARRVASARVDHNDPAQLASTRADAEGQLRTALGPAGSSAEIEWLSVAGGDVAVRVAVDGPRLLPPALRQHLPFHRIERQATVRVEQVP